MDRSTARKAALIATAVVAAGVVAYATTMRSTPPLGKQAFYYDLSAQKLFTDAAGQYPPIRGKHDAVGGDPEGHDGVLAIVYRCCDRCTTEKIQIAYLQKYTDKAKAIFEQADQAEAQGSKGPNEAYDRAFHSNNTLIQRPGDAQWHPKASPQGQAIVAILHAKCPNGHFPTLVDASER
ncbi:MAG: hypothetical protein KIT54_01810 [Phycisphaeraceae bacterium]|nr:hypothetical protein [Phycisphaeraceae bacterium]